MQRHGFRIKTHKDAIVVKSHWYCPDDGSDIAIVVVLTQTKDRHQEAYIGTGHDHRCEKLHHDDRDADEVRIAKWGAKISKETAESIFGPIENWLD